MNQVVLIGRLGGDPELRYTPGGKAVANFTLATNERWTDDSGAKQEKTEWHRIVVWGASAENCAQYLGKGSQAGLNGKLQTKKWKDKEGNDRYTTEVHALWVEFLDGAKKEKEAPATVAPVKDLDDDELPF